MVELLYMHINKTGGKSLENTLSDVYGSTNVLRVSQKQKFNPLVKMNFTKSKSDLTDNIRVINGHFVYKDLVNYFNLPDDIPIITLVRESVARVISSYFYTKNLFYNRTAKLLGTHPHSRVEK